MTPKFPETRDQLTTPGIALRLAAVLYDTLICLALLMMTTAIYMLIAGSLVGSEQYQEMNNTGQTTHDPLLSSILFIILFTFFAYFWTKNGQTLGMQAWHLRIQNHDNSRISWMQALVRFMTAIPSIGLFFLGYIWSIFDKKNRTWQCITSESEVVRIPKTK